MTHAEHEEWRAARQLAGNTPLLAAMREWSRARELAGAHFLSVLEGHGASRRMARELTVREALSAYLRARKGDGVQVDKGAARTFCPSVPSVNSRPDFLQAFGTRMLVDVTANELADWLAHFAHPVTRNTHRKRLVAFWRWCRKRGYLPDELTTAAERTDRASEPPSRIEVLGADELRRAFGVVGGRAPHLIPALALSAFCGMRRIEVHGQHWEDIDLKRGFLRVTQAKPGTPARRQVPIGATALAWLAPHVEKSGPMCPTLYLDRAKMLCRAAGITIPRNGLRHTWISARAELSGDLPRTALEGGTSVDVIHQHYRQLLTCEQAEAWFAVLPEASVGSVV